MACQLIWRACNVKLWTNEIVYQKGNSRRSSIILYIRLLLRNCYIFNVNKRCYYVICKKLPDDLFAFSRLTWATDKEQSISGTSKQKIPKLSVFRLISFMSQLCFIENKCWQQWQQYNWRDKTLDWKKALQSGWFQNGERREQKNNPNN